MDEGTAKAAVTGGFFYSIWWTFCKVFGMVVGTFVAIIVLFLFFVYGLPIAWRAVKYIWRGVMRLTESDSPSSSATASKEEARNKDRSSPK